MNYPYAQRKVEGRKKLAHRLVMEAHPGRSLLSSEIVHHLNHRKRDNRIENLAVMTAKEHAAHHLQKHPLTKVCVICGNTFTPHPTKRKIKRTCSKVCRYKLISLAWYRPRRVKPLKG